MATYPPPMIYRPERWSLATATPPAGEPVTVAELKDHLNLMTSDDDALVAALGKAARDRVERATNRVLVGQTRELRLDRFPYLAEQLIELPGGAVQEVSSIAYLDGNGDSQTWGSANWDAQLDTIDGTGRLGLAYGASWPSIREWSLPVTVTYVAGWADDGGSPPDYGANVPEALKAAIKLIAADLYERREAATPVVHHGNEAVRALLEMWRVRTIYAA